MTTQNTFAQSDYCTALQTEFKRSVEGHNTSEITFKYNKLVNACGVTEDEKTAVDEVFNESKYEISWRKDNSFEVIEFPDNEIDHSIYWENRNFDGLFDDDLIKQRHPNVYYLLESVGIDVKTLSGEPRFLFHYNAIWVPLQKGGVVLEMENLNPLFEIEADNIEMKYAGGGVFLVRQENNCIAYQLFHDYNRTEIKKVVDKLGFSITTIPVKSDEAYIIVTSSGEDRILTSVYNNQGKPLLENQHNVVFNQLSRTIITSKGFDYQLFDYEMKAILPEAAYIFEVWKDDIPYYIYDDKDDKRHLCDIEGNVVLSGKDYKSITINQTPYAIVRKGKEYGVIDFVSQEILFPFQTERIHHLCPGFMAISKNGEITIFDEKNRITGTVKAQSLSALNTNGKIVLKVFGENGKEGMCDLFGNVLLPTQYDAVEYKELENKILVTQGQIQFYTDMNGKEIKR